MKNCAATAAVALALTSGARVTRGADTPITPNASPEVQSLLAYFSSVYGKKILSGQHSGPRKPDDLGFELNYLTNTTGKLPAVLSLDLIASAQQAPRRDTEHLAAKSAIDWYANRNGIVSLCWHWYAPEGEPAFYTKDTKFDLRRGVVEGTPQHAAVLRDLDLIAGDLALLRDAHVPVLWRPLHEVNGRWFWWGAQGPEPYKKLWRLMFDRFTYQHGLTNLLWVFSPGAETDLAEWYPGDAYVDMIGQDHYPMDGNRAPAKDVFDELVALTRGNKFVGMSENGPIPDPDRMVSENAEWLFFTTWSGSVLTQRNSKEQLIRAFNHPAVLTLADLPDLKRYPFKPAGRGVRLGFTAAPGPVAAGGRWRLPVTVAVQDAEGRIVRDASATVTLALGNNPAGGVLEGTRTATTINGVATFSDLEIDRAGDGYTLTATATGLQKAASAAFQVGPGAGIERRWWSDFRRRKSRESADRGAPEARELLDKAFEVPVQSMTNYAARICGEVLAPVTGSYVFWIASAATSELWLSTNAAPSGARKIAGVTKWTPYRKWPHINESQSDPVRLEAGRRYYIEVWQTQTAGSAQLAVRWRLPDGVEERPIPAYRLFPRNAVVPAGTTAQNRSTVHD